MTLQMIEFPSGVREYCLRISKFELASARFDRIDFALIRECDSSPLVSDKLLALETIARRIEDKK